MSHLRILSVALPKSDTLPGRALPLASTFISKIFQRLLNQEETVLQHLRPQSNDIVSMTGATKVETVILPRLIRLTQEVEDSLIGRYASGKRP